MKNTILAILMVLSPTLVFSQETIETDLDRYITYWAASDEANIIEKQEMWLFRGYVCAKKKMSIQTCLDEVAEKSHKDFLSALEATQNKLTFDIPNRTVERDDGSVISLDQYFESIIGNDSNK